VRIIAFAWPILLPLLVVADTAHAVRAFWGDTTPDRQIRRQQADEWHAGIQQVQRQIPTLSPAEREWLATEYDAELELADRRFTKRALAAMSSREYQIRTVHEGLAQILPALKLLSSKDLLDTGKETRLWSIVAYGFMSNELWQGVDNLIERKILEQNVNGYNSYYFLNHVSAAQKILRSIVIPFLDNFGNK
jgi:hypothetical protein